MGRRATLWTCVQGAVDRIPDERIPGVGKRQGSKTTPRRARQIKVCINKDLYEGCDSEKPCCDDQTEETRPSSILAWRIPWTEEPGD